MTVSYPELNPAAIPTAAAPPAAPDTAPVTASEPTAAPSWEDRAVAVALRLAHPQFPAIELARLRRLDPEQPLATAFWQLLADLELPTTRATEPKWGAIVQGIALMTPNQRRGQPQPPDGFWPSAHNPNIPFGAALYYGGDPNRQRRAFCPENRLLRLLQSHGKPLRWSVSQLCAQLGPTRQAANWRQISRLLLSDSYDRAESATIRKIIAADYYRGLNRSRRSSQSDAEETE